MVDLSQATNLEIKGGAVAEDENIAQLAQQFQQQNAASGLVPDDMLAKLRASMNVDGAGGGIPSIPGKGNGSGKGGYSR